MANRNSKFKPLTKSAILKRLAAIVVLLNVCFFSIFFFSLRQSRIQYEERAAISTRNLSLTLQKQLVGVIEKINIALLTVSDEVEHQSAHGAINGQEMNLFLSRLHARLPELDSLRATNAHGDIIYGVGVDPGKISNISDRDYFTSQRNQNAGLVISKPVIGRINGKWNLVFSVLLNNLWVNISSWRSVQSPSSC